MTEEKKVTIELDEKDKPFILALVGSAITILFGIFTAVSAPVLNPDMSKTVFEMTLPLTSTAWGYYFAKKQQ